MAPKAPPRPPPRLAVYAYPWAIGRLGAERELDRLVAAGVDGIQLALSYHAASYLTPRDPRRRIHVGDVGSVWFDYQAGAPGPWKLRPPVSDEAAAAVPAVLSAAAERGVQVVAWLVYLYSHALARHRRDLAVRNAFGDPGGAHLCPANPEVRSFAVQLTAAALALDDVASPSPAFTGLHAEALGFHPFDHGLPWLKAGVKPNPKLRRLLTLCLCDYCRAAAAAAGHDPDELVAVVRAGIDEALNAGTGAPDSTPGDRVLSSVRADITVSLNREVRAVAVERGLRFSTTAAEPDAARLEADAAMALRAVVDEVRVRVGPGSTTDTVRAAMAAANSGCQTGVFTFAQYDLHTFTSEAELLRVVESAQAAGLAHHRVYEHSGMTEAQMSWLRSVATIVT